MWSLGRGTVITFFFPARENERGSGNSDIPVGFYLFLESCCGAWWVSWVTGSWWLSHTVGDLGLPRLLATRNASLQQHVNAGEPLPQLLILFSFVYLLWLRSCLLGHSCKYLYGNEPKIFCLSVALCRSLRVHTYDP